MEKESHRYVYVFSLRSWLLLCCFGGTQSARFGAGADHVQSDLVNPNALVSCKNSSGVGAYRLSEHSGSHPASSAYFSN